jgi:hypothetical protein
VLLINNDSDVMEYEKKEEKKKKKKKGKKGRLNSV